MLIVSLSFTERVITELTLSVFDHKEGTSVQYFGTSSPGQGRAI